MFSRRRGIFSGAEPANQHLLILYTPSSQIGHYETEMILDYILLIEIYERINPLRMFDEQAI